ncbi:MAG: hypothetical protein ACOYMN_08105 [Roseimicrobium sp.]
MAYVSTIQAFPWCQTTGTTPMPAVSSALPHTNFPIVVPYDVAFAWYWRVRRWHVRVDVDYILVNLSNPSVTRTGTLLDTTTVTVAEDNEAKLVCGNVPRILDAPTLYGTETDQFGDVVALECRARLSLMSGSPCLGYPVIAARSARWLMTTAQQFVPNLVISCVFTGALGYATTGYDSTATTNTVDARIAGRDVPMRILSDALSGYSGTRRVAVTLTPDLYWGYDPGDDEGPIWNTNSGVLTGRAIPK